MASKSPKAKRIVAQQILSWKIYEQQGLKNWYPCVENMKKNFERQYQLALANDRNPKVFVKMGALHIARGTSSGGFKELGDMVHELAKSNGSKAFSVISFARYRINVKNEVIDLLEEEDAELLRYTNSHSWSLIDLQRLDAEAKKGGVTPSKTMLSYIEKFDMMLIPPATKSMEPNFHPY